MSLDSEAAVVREADQACVPHKATRTMDAEIHGGEGKETVIETFSGGTKTMPATDSACN
jgi:hypothetical protein